MGRRRKVHPGRARGLSAREDLGRDEQRAEQYYNKCGPAHGALASAAVRARRYRLRIAPMNAFP